MPWKIIQIRRMSNQSQDRMEKSNKIRDNRRASNIMMMKESSSGNNRAVKAAKKRKTKTKKRNRSNRFKRSPKRIKTNNSKTVKVITKTCGML